ncbi:MAG: hypothetical protein ABIF01_00770, partial [Candidatus Micrarchaeota archaeon]
ACHILVWHLKNSRDLAPKKKNILLEAIAETAVEVANASSLARTMIRASRGDSFETGMRTLLKICKNNPWAVKDRRFKRAVLDELETYIRNDFRDNEMHGAQVSGAHKTMVDVLVQVGGERAVELLAKIVDSAYLPEANMSAVRALKEVGQDNPVVAIRTLKKWGIGDNRKKATDAVVQAVAAHADIHYGNSALFWRDIRAVLQDEGLGAIAISKIGKEVKRGNITSLSEMTKMAVDKMGFGHPFWNRRAAGVLSAARNTVVQVEQMETPVMGGRILVTERKTPIHRRAVVR